MAFFREELEKEVEFASNVCGKKYMGSSHYMSKLIKLGKTAHSLTHSKWNVCIFKFTDSSLSQSKRMDFLIPNSNQTVIHILLKKMILKDSIFRYPLLRR